MPVIIKTNHHWREFKCSADVPDKAWEDTLSHVDAFYGFFQYQKDWYYVGDFLKIYSPALKDWNAYYAFGWNVGIVIKLSNDNDQFQIGTFQFTS